MGVGTEGVWPLSASGPPVGCLFLKVRKRKRKGKTDESVYRGTRSYLRAAERGKALAILQGTGGHPIMR